MVLVLFAMRNMLNLILITFIFTFLLDRMQDWIYTRCNRWVPINRKVIIIFIYAAVITCLSVGFYRYFPVIVIQTSQLIRLVTDFYNHPQDNEWINYLIDTSKRIELSGYIKQGLDILYKSVTNIGKWGIQIILALILSLFFLLEKERILSFTSKFKQSKLADIHYELSYFGSRFTRSFGKVIEAQFLIALVNCVISVIALWLMGFPQLFGLGLMIFFLGMIPVAGVIISLIPLCTIAFSLGGIEKVIYVVVMIIIIHAIESYFLNPKLLSSKTDLPVFYTFIVLIFSEHFLGVWGLIIGIPIFMFLLDVLDVTDKEQGNRQIRT